MTMPSQVTVAIAATADCFCLWLRGHAVMQSYGDLGSNLWLEVIASAYAVNYKCTLPFPFIEVEVNKAVVCF